MKKLGLGLLALLFLAPLVPMAGAQVVVKIGHPHRYYHNHHYYQHHDHGRYY